MVGPLIAPYALALNHPCVDENTRVAHAAMETCLLLNGMTLHGSVDEQEQLMLALARADSLERPCRTGLSTTSAQ